jgi:hypothetical protein
MLFLTPAWAFARVICCGTKKKVVHQTLSEAYSKFPAQETKEYDRYIIFGSIGNIL